MELTTQSILVRRDLPVMPEAIPAQAGMEQYFESLKAFLIAAG